MSTDNQSQKQNIFKMEESKDKTPEKTSTGLEPNIAGLLCYLAGFVTGIIFLLIEKENRFVRFHAIQSIIVFGSVFVLGLVFTVIPLVGWLLSLLLSPLTLVLWIYLMWKAYQNEWTKIPVAGNLAEKQLNK